MPTPIRSPRFGPPGAPAYYLVRPATWRLTALHRQARRLIPALTRRASPRHPATLPSITETFTSSPVGPPDDP